MSTEDRIRMLIVEDNPDDVELFLTQLRSGGLVVDAVVVADESTFMQRIEEPFDVALFDCSLPGFGAFRALDLLKARGIGIPVIVVSGVVSDDLAAQCLKRGAADYLLKDRLARLVSAVERAILESKARPNV